MSKKGKQAARSKPQRKESSSGRQAAPKSRSGGGRAAAHLNLQAVKIIAGVLGLLCLAGAAALFFVQQAPYPTNVIIEVVLLGFIAGLCLFAVLRTERFVGFFKKL